VLNTVNVQPFKVSYTLRAASAANLWSHALSPSRPRAAFMVALTLLRARARARARSPLFHCPPRLMPPLVHCPFRPLPPSFGRQLMCALSSRARAHARARMGTRAFPLRASTLFTGHSVRSSIFTYRLRPYARTLFLFRSLACSLARTHSLLARQRARALSLSHRIVYCRRGALPCEFASEGGMIIGFKPPSLPPSLPPSVPPSVPPSLPPSITHSLTPSHCPQTHARTQPRSLAVPLSPSSTRSPSLTRNHNRSSQVCAGTRASQEGTPQKSCRP